MAVSVLIPWQGGCEHRRLALDWVLDKYRQHHPDWRIHIGELPEGVPWSKGRAAMPLVPECHETVVLADADVWCDGLAEAVAAVQAGARWSIPHTLVRRLTAQATHDALQGHVGEALDERPYPGIPGGGLVVMPREVIASCPLDPRFVGWGRSSAKRTRSLVAFFTRSTAGHGAAPPT